MKNIDSLTKRSPELENAGQSIGNAIALICDAFERERKLFIAGNGGSMSDALHISGELLKSFAIERKGYEGYGEDVKGLQPGAPVWVLGNNPSLTSAVGNDLPEKGLGFAQELFAAGKRGDVLLGISTSGGAENVQRAFRVAKAMGIKTVSLTGTPGEPMSSLADVAIKTPGGDTAEIQEYHVRVYHAFCAEVEEQLFGEGGRLTGPYGTSFGLFDFSKIKTYSLSERENRTDLSRLVLPESIPPQKSKNPQIAHLAEQTNRARKRGLPVIVMMGAHLIKNGLSPLLIDLLERGCVSLVACNGACPIHDVELAFCGGTSESVPEALPQGKFGFANETAEIVNGSYLEAFKRNMGAGEALGAVLAGDVPLGEQSFPYREHSLLYAAYKRKIPVTVHATIGTDIVDQHPSANFEAKGRSCGTDFLIFAEKITHLEKGGVIIDIGGAVTQPEVLLKATSMAANVGKAPRGITTAVLDLFDVDLGDIDDEEKPGYYRRDIKSVVVRIPKAFGGRGLYIQGNQKDTFVALYSHLKYLMESETGA